MLKTSIYYVLFFMSGNNCFHKPGYKGLLSYLIYKMLCFDLVICCLNRGNEMTYIGYNMNYMKVLE